MRVNKAAFGAATALTVAWVLSAPAALANSQSYTGGNCSTPGGCASNTFGALMLPTSITFTDNPLSVGTTTDDWYFMVPAASLGSTITGGQISLQNFAVSGTVDTYQLWTTTGLGGSLSTEIASGTVTSPFQQVLLDPSVSSGDYALVVNSTLNPGSTGNYTGSLVIAAPVPLPAAVWLLASGLGVLGGALRARRPTA
jgi:hypothetical protein